MRVFLVVLLGVGAIPVGAIAQCTAPPEFTWNGSEGPEWDVADNWTPNARVPGSGDRAYIPSVADNYPVINGNHVTVCELELEKTGNSNPTLTIAEHASTSNAIVVTGRNGLSVGAECEIHIAKAGILSLGAPGTVLLDGNIVFVDSNGPIGPPSFLLPTGATMLTGDGYILGADDANNYAFIGGGNNHDNWLVVGPNNALYGSLWIAAGVVNNGLIDPNGQDSPTYGRTLYLTCTPKIGSGRWEVTGGALVEEQPRLNTLLIDVPVATSGSVKIGSYGVLDIRNHFTVMGKFEMDGNGKYSVAQNILFDAHRFAKACDYTGS